MKFGLLDCLFGPIRRIFGMLPIKPPEQFSEAMLDGPPDEPMREFRLRVTAKHVGKGQYVAINVKDITTEFQ